MFLYFIKSKNLIKSNHQQGIVGRKKLGSFGVYHENLPNKIKMNTVPSHRSFTQD